MSVSPNLRTIVFRAPTAAAVNAMQATIERLVAKPSTLKWSDKAKKAHSGYSAVTMFQATDVGRHAADELEALKATAVFKGNCEVVRRQVSTFCGDLLSETPVILWSWAEGRTHITEVFAYVPAFMLVLGGNQGVDGYNRLPLVVNQAISRMNELYLDHQGYSVDLMTELSRKLSRHVNGLLDMDADKLDAWHVDSLRLIAEVEKVAKKNSSPI